MLDAGGCQRCDNGGQTRGLKFYRVAHRCPGTPRLEGVVDPRAEGPDLALDLQPGRRLEGGHLEGLVASARYRAGLVVGGSDPDRPRRDLRGLDDGEIPSGDVLEVGQE